MRSRGNSDGFTLVEVLVSLTLVVTVMMIMAVLLVRSARLNKSQQMKAGVQANARSTLSLVTQVLRTAGWDPQQNGFPSVGLDSVPSDATNYIDVYADLNADDDVSDTGESVRIQHVADRVEWRKTTAGSFETVGVNISNDANGDGTEELMFTPDTSPNPTRITVRVTAASPSPDPTTGQPFRYTVSNDVYLRNN